MTNTKCYLHMIRTLGVGGMATVHLARLDDGRDVAVKKLHPFLASDPMSVAALEDEAKLGAAIRHPNVVGIVDFLKDENGVPMLIMDWVEGIDLGRLVRAANAADERLPIDVIAAIARDILAGLHAAHEARREDGLSLDIVHRDVSPQNILVGFDGVSRVTDFGVAKAKWRQQHTEQGSVKGKVGYLAPEQLSGRCDRRSDVFSVGAVMWELLTGTRLRAGEGVEVLVEILYGHVEAPSVHSPDAACLDDVVMRALERLADDRFETAADMIALIEHLVTPASPDRVAEVIRELLGEEETMTDEEDLSTSGVRPKASWMAPAMASTVVAVARAEQRAPPATRLAAGCPPPRWITRRRSRP